MHFVKLKAVPLINNNQIILSAALVERLTALVKLKIQDSPDDPDERRINVYLFINNEYSYISKVRI